MVFTIVYQDLKRSATNIMLRKKLLDLLMEYLLKAWPPNVLKGSETNLAGVRSLETNSEEDNHDLHSFLLLSLYS